MTRAMPLTLPNELLWAAAGGGAMLAFALAAPFVNRWRVRRHALRLEARRQRGHDRYHEELRSLEAWPPEGDTAFNARTVLGALAGAVLVALLAYAWARPDADRLEPLVGIAIATCGLAAALWQGFGIWREAQPDPRQQIISPAHHDHEARERRHALWGRIGSVVALAAVSFVIALSSAGDALELLR